MNEREQHAGDICDVMSQAGKQAVATVFFQLSEKNKEVKNCHPHFTEFLCQLLT